MTPPGCHTRPTCNQGLFFFLSSSQSLDPKPPPRACQWSTVSHSVCFLDLTTPLLIRFRHLFHVQIPFIQTMVRGTFHPLHKMASSPAHDIFRQEANTLSSFRVLMQKMGVTSLGRHTRPACHQDFTRSLKLCEECRFNSCVRVFFIPWGHVNFYDHIWAFVTSISHMGEILDSDWSRQNLLRSDWLLPSVACITTIQKEGTMFIILT